MLLVAAGVVAVVALAAGTYTVLGGGGDRTTVASTPRPPTQLTMLVQVTGVDGTAAASALVGTTAKTGDAVAVLVPSRLVVDIAGSGDIAFGEGATLGEPAASADALTDLLGVTVADTWELSRQGLAALVDEVGGVQAAVDVDVVATDAKGTETVVVRAGNQRLGGDAAAAYATYLVEGEPEQARLARFDDVLTAMVAALPGDQVGIVAALGKLGEGSSSTLDSPALADRLVVLRRAVGSSSLVSDVLPVTELDTGGPTVAYGVDAAQATAMMANLFPTTLQRDPGGATLRVLVENGVGTPGLADKARSKLVAAGFRFVNGGNNSPFTDDPSAILVADGTEKNLARGARVARALGLPESSVQPTDRGQTLADVIVLLGSDFVP